MLLEDLRIELENGGFPLPVYEGDMPDQPDDLAAIYEYGGGSVELHWDGEYARVQVRTRSKSYVAARAAAEAAITILHGVANQDINGTRYLLIRALAPATSLGRDKAGRVDIAVSFEIIKYRG